MRLAKEEEPLHLLSPEELNTVVQPPYDYNFQSLHDDHSNKQAMAFAELRRSKDKLRYLKNLRNERKNENLKRAERCMVCLGPFDGERAVLRCGHYV
eukprot:CAMPEP_0113330930 /NCGR_PEP_ID=MMETSP0010_2-20120614/22085_1 /TAXON_ID=216773 ORGANISM="Corethron hystrix, Strain 308" /NCGR_SAMPLE_ID=MMETSP0010_2 /ASSEMBLY_ACC=CAM_ASM_000155 /LENGTH=96 /DNA_ID=CAMNT_0000193897 /DNA_START=502 /DNA_END=789 /DNA_ORIENTATION=- /assembly_acc=CAM_ASM_000155